MSTSTVHYLGNLKTSNLHLQSGKEILTDAPVDNQGEGSAFSPTDLMATSLANCAITTMGIVAKREGIDMEGVSAKVTKVMYSEPRRVGEIHVHITFPEKHYSDKEKKLLENTAKACPVGRSLHPDLKQVFEFSY